MNELWFISSNRLNVTQKKTLRDKIWLPYFKVIGRPDKARRSLSPSINEPAGGLVFLETNPVPILTTQPITQEAKCPISSVTQYCKFGPQNGTKVDIIVHYRVQETATAPNCTIMQHFMSINIKWTPQRQTQSSFGGALYCSTINCRHPRSCDLLTGFTGRYWRKNALQGNAMRSSYSITRNPAKAQSMHFTTSGCSRLDGFREKEDPPLKRCSQQNRKISAIVHMARTESKEVTEPHFANAIQLTSWHFEHDMLSAKTATTPGSRQLNRCTLGKYTADLLTHSNARCALQCSVLVTEMQAPGVIDAYKKYS
ncbi:hypothetical protein CLF_104678 [Clonorchis sinensis]|uniref:Uncharacterized protein n=1 Tax=Clonorchis sinensis TaxID=79923 RepID=G7YC36_CLOSI|nr:hypothetical protein CLF_104678 [Clonorchis sinensis]